MKQGGEQLALGEIAGRPEQDQYVVIRFYAIHSHASSGARGRRPMDT
jgi:hypothetical protein